MSSFVICPRRRWNDFGQIPATRPAGRVRVMLQVKPDSAEAFLLRERRFELSRNDHADGFLIFLHGLDGWGHTIIFSACVDSGDSRQCHKRPWRHTMRSTKRCSCSCSDELRHHVGPPVLSFGKRIRLLRKIADKLLLLRIERYPWAERGRDGAEIDAIFAQILAATIECI